MKIALASLVAIPLAVGAGLGCGAQADRPNRDSMLPPPPEFVQQELVTLESPQLSHLFGLPPESPQPFVIPYSVVSLKGTSPGATDVLIEGAGNTTHKVLPGGVFCVDVSGLNPDLYTFSITGYDGRGYSAPLSVQVEIDPNAPPPQPIFTEEVETCLGRPPTSCPNLIEICDNGINDNCNSLVDDEDPQCVSCYDDSFDVGGGAQQNDSGPQATRIELDRSYDLALCPGDEDFFVMPGVRSGQTVVAAIGLDYPFPTLYAQILSPTNAVVAYAPINETTPVSLTYTVKPGQDGDYRVRVYGVNSDNNNYNLRLSVTNDQ